MWSLKAFLLEEIANVERCLNESLRNDYGNDKGAGFFEECSKRVRTLRQVALDTDPYQPRQQVASHLGDIADQTVELAELISRLERSHRGEISWAVAQRIEELAQAVCADKTNPDRETTKNLFYFGSEGSLDKYAIYPEKSDSYVASARIFSVIFPRSLKHNVLLHPILGHEIAHAACAIPALGKRVEDLIDDLAEDSPLDDPLLLRAWLLRHLPKQDIDDLPEWWFRKTANYWLSEIFCDLFGLLLFGPSYIGAHCVLLGAMDPLGNSWDHEHPPVTCRTHVIRTAASHLNLLSDCDEVGEPFSITSRDLWPELENQRLDFEWAEIVEDSKVRSVLDELIAQNDAFGGVFHSNPQPAELRELSEQALRRVPPVRVQRFDQEGIPLVVSDFRDVLFAGWITWARRKVCWEHKPLSFFDLNRLCEHAILQNLAISRQINTIE